MPADAGLATINDSRPPQAGGGSAPCNTVANSNWPLTPPRKAGHDDKHPHLSRLAELTELARQKVRDTTRDLPTWQVEAAAALLTEIYGVGLRHGISPSDWSAVVNLLRDCLDALSQRDHCATLCEQKLSIDARASGQPCARGGALSVSVSIRGTVESRPSLAIHGAAVRPRCSTKTIRRYVANAQLSGYRFGSTMLRLRVKELDVMVARRAIPNARTR